MCLWHVRGVGSSRRDDVLSTLSDRARAVARRLGHRTCMVASLVCGFGVALIYVTCVVGTQHCVFAVSAQYGVICIME